MKKRWILLSSFLASAVFTVLDTIVHYFYKPLEIYHYPIKLLGIQSALANYALSKLFSTTVLLFIFFWLLAKVDLKKIIEYQIVIIGVIVLLEVRYILGGYYTAEWHVLNFINHYIALAIGVYLFRKIRDRT